VFCREALTACCESRCESLLFSCLQRNKDVEKSGRRALEAWLDVMKHLLLSNDDDHMKVLLNNLLHAHREKKTEDVKTIVLVIRGYSQLASPIKKLLGEDKLLEVWVEFSNVVTEALHRAKDQSSEDDGGDDQLNSIMLPDITIAYGDIIPTIVVSWPSTLASFPFRFCNAPMLPLSEFALGCAAQVVQDAELKLLVNVSNLLVQTYAQSLKSRKWMIPRAWAYLLYSLSCRDWENSTSPALERFVEQAVLPALNLSIEPVYSENVAAPGCVPESEQYDQPCVQYANLWRQLASSTTWEDYIKRRVVDEEKADVPRRWAAVKARFFSQTYHELACITRGLDFSFIPEVIELGDGGQQQVRTRSIDACTLLLCSFATFLKILMP
jgi:hypothetical protein